MEKDRMGWKRTGWDGKGQDGMEKTGWDGLT